MKEPQARLIARGATTAACLLMTVAAVQAQGGGVVAPPPPSSMDMKARMREQERREAALRTAELRPTVEATNQRRIDAAVEQVKQDFKRIQIVRNEMVHNLMAHKPFDYKLISDETGEINKRANRLKLYLVAPETSGVSAEKAQKEPGSLAQEELQGALVKLCNLVISFVENPVLQAPGTVDVQQSAKANRDLQSIIELSNHIRKSAERLSKPPK